MKRKTLRTAISSSPIDKSSESKKRTAEMTKLLTLAINDCFNFRMIQQNYTIPELIELGLENKIPNILKFQKYADKIHIKNCSGMPVLCYTKKEIDY